MWGLINWLMNIKCQCLSVEMLQKKFLGDGGWILTINLIGFERLNIWNWGEYEMKIGHYTSTNNEFTNT